MRYRVGLVTGDSSGPSFFSVSSGVLTLGRATKKIVDLASVFGGDDVVHGDGIGSRFRGVGIGVVCGGVC
uniref:Uncharacterized protein n=1 Tax=Tanacetum cinerariifolium TaxID=118510 RepID=A0A6L2JD47_TANCI|nr:hypothetical protein [Tanacetum cinerariifolium]